MTCVRVVCDANFKKSDDVDKSVAKVLKMFSDHFVEKTSPLSKDSDMECVYVYDDLTPEQVRILKRLLNQNKTLLNFKEIIISKPGDKKKKKKQRKSAAETSSVDTSSDQDLESVLSQSSKDSARTALSQQSSKPSSASNSSSASLSSNSSNSSSQTTKKARVKFKKAPKKASKKNKKSQIGESKIAEITRRLRELADELENI